MSPGRSPGADSFVDWPVIEHLECQAGLYRAYPGPESDPGDGDTVNLCDAKVSDFGRRRCVFLLPVRTRICTLGCRLSRVPGALLLLSVVWDTGSTASCHSLSVMVSDPFTLPPLLQEVRLCWAVFIQGLRWLLFTSV